MKECFQVVNILFMVFRNTASIVYIGIIVHLDVFVNGHSLLEYSVPILYLCCYNNVCYCDHEVRTLRSQ